MLTIYDIDNVNVLHSYLIDKIPNFHRTTMDDEGNAVTTPDSARVEQNPLDKTVYIYLPDSIDAETINLHIQQYKLTE